jgi:hypothetical protein
MRVDAPGLVAAAQRLITALEALGGSGVGHPPLAADPASVVAAERLTTAGAELTAALAAHVAALVGSLEVLSGAALRYLDTDDQNAAVISALRRGVAGGAGGPGFAPPAPPIPPDVRAPMPAPVGMAPKAIAVAVHSGAPGDGEVFIGAWSHVAEAARNGSATIRSAVAELPEVLSGPMSTPAVSQHMLKFAAGLDTYADRAHTLVKQAKAYASNQIGVRADIPAPQQLINSENNVRTLTAANAASGGKHFVALANAINVNNRLNEQAVTGYPPYHARTDAATAGDDPGSEEQGPPTDPTTANPADDRPGVPDADAADPSAQALTPEAGGELVSLVPQLLGAAGGLVGGVMGAVTKVPEALMQAGSQALGAAQGLSGLAAPKTGPPATGGPSPGGGEPGGAGGGDAPTTAAGGGGAPDLPVAPSTGAPPAAAIAPVGAAEGPGASGAPAGVTGMTPMGMPMGGLGGAPGGAGGGKAEDGRKRKVVVPQIPHTEDVTGRVDTNRLSAAAAAHHHDRNPQPPEDDNPPDAAAPVVRRLVPRAPKEPL